MRRDLRTDRQQHQMMIRIEATVGVDGLRPMVMMAKANAQTKNIACGTSDRRAMVADMPVPKIICDVMVKAKRSPVQSTR